MVRSRSGRSRSRSNSSSETPSTPSSAAASAQAADASWEATFTGALSDEVQTVVGMLDMSSPEHRFRQDLIKKTKAKVRESFPRCTVEVYGSWETRLALPSSDIDFVVLGCANIPKDSMLKKVATSFEAIGLKCTAILPSARVPVLKFICPVTGLRGDLTLDVGNWQDSISLVRKLLNDYSSYSARDIIVLLKLVLVLTSNNEVCKGGLSSYGVCLMAQNARAQALEERTAMREKAKRRKEWEKKNPEKLRLKRAREQARLADAEAAEKRAVKEAQSLATQYAKILPRCNCVLNVLDARAPLASVSQELERLLVEHQENDLESEKTVVYVLNKVDLVPRAYTEAWVKHLSAKLYDDDKLKVIAYLRRAKEAHATPPSRGALLLGFLDHYRTGGTFDPTSMTVDISQPQGFRQGTMRPMSSRHTGSYCVQDPLNTGNNVTEQCFSMGKITDMFQTMWEGLTDLRKQSSLPEGGGKVACGLLRHVVEDLHLFQRQRTQLLDRWMAQERWENALNQQGQLQDWARLGGYGQFASPLGQPMGLVPYLNPQGWVPPAMGRALPAPHGNGMLPHAAGGYHNGGRKNHKNKHRNNNHNHPHAAASLANAHAHHPFTQYASAYGYGKDMDYFNQQGMLNPFLMFPPYGVPPATALHNMAGAASHVGGGASAQGSSGADSGSNSDRASESSQDSIGGPHRRTASESSHDSIGHQESSERASAANPPAAAPVAA